MEEKYGINDIKIVPWEPGELGVAIEFSDGKKLCLRAKHHKNCFFVKRIDTLEGAIEDALNVEGTPYIHNILSDAL